MPTMAIGSFARLEDSLDVVPPVVGVVVPV